MRKKLFLVLAVVCIAAVFAGVFAGCNNDGKGGGAAAGDKIFTEGATLQGILTALENAESVSFVYDYTIRFFNDPEEIEGQATYREIAEYTRNIAHYSVDNTTVYTDGTTDGYFGDGYAFAEGDMVYMINSYRPSGEEAEIDGTKCMSKYSEFSAAEYSANFVEAIEYMLTEKDGKVVFNEAEAPEGYVAGSGYVVLEGSVLRIGYKDESETSAQEFEYRISGINATTVTVPAEIAAEKANASWQETVHYNGVTYEKWEDADGEYYVAHAGAGAAIEETINSLPVRKI